MNYPKSIKRCPIIETSCEIRFSIADKNVSSEIVPLLIASSIKNTNLSKLQKLPILELPEQVRTTNPDLLYAPYYKLNHDHLELDFGARSITIRSPMPYVGWNVLKPKIDQIIDSIMASKQQITLEVESISIRTVNFFEDDILNNLKFYVNTPITKEIKGYQYTDIYHDKDVVIKTTIANRVEVEEVDTKEKTQGSILDVHTHLNTAETKDILKFKNDINRVHDAGKNIFFELLKSEFLESLEPHYE